MFRNGHKLTVVGGNIADCAPDWEWKSDGGREVFNLWLISRGEGRLTSNMKDYNLSPGDCFLLKLWQPQHGRHNPKKPLLVPYVLFEWRDAGNRLLYMNDNSFPCPRFQVTNISFLQTLVERCLDAFQQGKADEASMWLKSALLELDHSSTGNYSGLEMEQYAKIDRICRRITKDPGRRYSVEQLAAECHYTPDHFIRLFKKYKGKTPCEFMISQRLHEAETLLLFSEYSLAQIAGKLGYSDEFNFSMQFKKHLGQSPAHFRAAHEKKQGNALLTKHRGKV